MSLSQFVSTVVLVLIIIKRFRFCRKKILPLNLRIFLQMSVKYLGDYILFIKCSKIIILKNVVLGL